MARTRAVDVALVLVHDPPPSSSTDDPTLKFFVAYNPRWHGYAFPMKKRRFVREAPDSAIQALTEIIGKRRSPPKGRLFGEYKITGPSGSRTFLKETTYHYRVYLLELGAGRPLPAGGLAANSGLLSYADLRGPNLITWSTKALAAAIMEDQQAGIAVLARWNSPAGGKRFREYLLVRNERYDGLFFPASRLKAQVHLVHLELGEFKGLLDPSDLADAAEKEAVAALRKDCRLPDNTDLGISAEYRGTVEGKQRSRTFGQVLRGYRHHLCKVTLARHGKPLDLHQAGNPLEQALGPRKSDDGWNWDWVSEYDISLSRDPRLSRQTVGMVNQLVLKIKP